MITSAWWGTAESERRGRPLRSSSIALHLRPRPHLLSRHAPPTHPNEKEQHQKNEEEILNRQVSEGHNVHAINEPHDDHGRRNHRHQSTQAAKAGQRFDADLPFDDVKGDNNI